MAPDLVNHHQIQLQPITTAGNEDPEHQEAAAMAKSRNLMWWIKVLIYAAVIIACQSAVVLLARLYFVKGGTSKWISLISQLGGFPVLIPYYIYSNFIKHRHNVNDHHLPPLTYGSFYVFQGILIWGSTYLYTIGLQYLPVSTSTIIASSQLAFNALFSYFINSQKFTPFITNSLFLLTLSSVLLVFGGDPSGSTSTGGGKYAVGFICTVAGAAGFGLYFSVSEYGFRKLGAGLRVVMNMMMFQGMVASGLGLIGGAQINAHKVLLARSL